MSAAVSGGSPALELNAPEMMMRLSPGPASPMNDDADAHEGLDRDDRDDLSVRSQGSVKTSMSLSRVLIRQEVGSQTEISGLINLDGNAAAAAVGAEAVVVAAAAGGAGVGSADQKGILTDSLSEVSALGLGFILPPFESAHVGGGGATLGNVDSLRIDGIKATRTDRKEREKWLAALSEQQQAVQLREQAVTEQALFLNERAQKLAGMVEILAAQEQQLRQQARLLDDETRHLQLARAPRGGGGFDYPPDGGKGGSMVSDSANTQSFLESGLEVSLAAQAQTEAEELGHAAGAARSFLSAFPLVSRETEALRRELGEFGVASGRLLGSRAGGDSTPSSHSARYTPGGGPGGGPGRRPPSSPPPPQPLTGAKEELSDDLSVGSRMRSGAAVSGGLGLGSNPNPGLNSPSASVCDDNLALLHSLGRVDAPAPALPDSMAVMLNQTHSGGALVASSERGDVIVIFPPTVRESQTDMTDFREHLAAQIKRGDPRQPQVLEVAASVSSKSKKKAAAAAGGGKVSLEVAAAAATGITKGGASNSEAIALGHNTVQIQIQLPSALSTRSTQGSDKDGGVHIDDSDGEEEGKEKRDRSESRRRNKQGRDADNIDGGGSSVIGSGSVLSEATSYKAKLSLLLPDAAKIAVGAAGGQEQAQSRAADGGLHIVSRSEIGLTTRTYRPPPALDVAKALQESDNPILTLLDIYSPSLPEVFQALMYEAAAGAGLAKSQAAVEKAFAPMVAPLAKLDASALAALRELSATEELSGSLIVLLDSGEVPVDTYRRSLAQLFQQIAQCDGVRLWIEVQLVAFRTMFERVRALSLSMLGDLSRECPSFRDSFESFSSCQSRLVEVERRIEAIKERCVRYRLAHADTWKALNANANANDGLNGGGSGMLSGPAGMAGIGNNVGVGPLRSIAEASVSLDDAIALEIEVERLTRELGQAEEEIDDLNLEVFRVMQEADRTPAALLFFSALHDPVLLSVLQQLVLQLTQLKGFTDGSAHVDFLEVRKRLQVCLSCAPSIERLVQRYSVLHKKWTANRLGIFTNRGLTGGSGDATNLCPMCNNDPSLFSAAPRPGPARRERGHVSQNQQQHQQENQHLMQQPHQSGGGHSAAALKEQRRNKKLARISDRIDAAEAQWQRDKEREHREGGGNGGGNVPSRTSTAMTDRTSHSQSLPALAAVGSGGQVGSKKQLVALTLNQPTLLPPSRG